MSQLSCRLLVLVLSTVAAPIFGTATVDKTVSDGAPSISPAQEKYCRHNQTEAPYSGKYVDTTERGRYHCSQCGTTLFSSELKFDSGTGCAAFRDVLKPGLVNFKDEKTLGVARTEVLCAHCGAHLGYVYDDGPGVLGKRYCINSACLDFRKLAK